MTHVSAFPIGKNLTFVAISVSCVVVYSVLPVVKYDLVSLPR